MSKKELVKILENFLSVRKSIAMLITFTFCYLAISGLLSSTEFTSIFSMVIGFYFGRSTALDVPGASKQPERTDE